MAQPVLDVKRPQYSASKLYSKFITAKARQAERNRKYQELRAYWEGDFDQSEDSRGIVANYLFKVVNQYQSLLAFTPDIRVPPVGTGKDDQEFADFLEMVLYASWKMNDMPKKLIASGHNLSKLGMAVISTLPNFDEGTVDINLAVPDYFIPIQGRHPMEYDSYFYAYHTDEDEVAQYLPGGREAGEGYIEVIQYWDRNVMHKWVDGNHVGTLEHGWGILPHRAIANIVRPEKIDGHSDIEQAVGLNQYLNVLFNYEADILSYISGMPAVLKTKRPDDKNYKQNVVNNLRPDGLITLDEGDDIGFLNPGEVPYDLDQQQDRAKAYLQETTGLSEVLFGNASGGLSGAAVSQLANPTMMTIAARQIVLGSDLAEVNSNVLTLYEKVFPDKEIKLWGMRNGEWYSVEFKGSDIKGNRWNDIIWPPDRFNEQARDVSLLQKLGAGLISKRYAMEHMNIENPSAVMKQIEAEKKAEMALQVQHNGQMPNPDQAAKDAVTLRRGGMPANEVVDQGTPETPGQRKMPRGQTATLSEVAQNVARAAQSAVGRVWLMGDLVSTGQATGTIQVGLSNMLDKQQMMQRLPNLHGRVEFVDVGNNGPQQQAIEVTRNG